MLVRLLIANLPDHKMGDIVDVKPLELDWFTFDGYHFQAGAFQSITVLEAWANLPAGALVTIGRKSVVKLVDQWEQYPGISDLYCVEVNTGRIETISKYLDLDDIFTDQFSCTKDHECQMDGSLSCL